MSPTHTNGQSANQPIAGPSGTQAPKLASPAFPEAAALCVVDLPTDMIHTPPDNEIDMELVEELRANMAEHGQWTDVVVYPAPEKHGHYVCADGNHRLVAKRLLGQTIRARILDKAPDEAELITLRVTTTTIRKTLDKAAVGADILRWLELTGCDQIQATAHFGFKSQGTISKLLRPYKNGVDELIAALKQRRLPPTSAYLVAALPADIQRSILPQCLGKKRDAVQRIVEAAKGVKPKAGKLLKLASGSVVATVKGDPVAALRAFCTKLAAALKKLERDKLPPEFLCRLMQ
jgi:hypothetical protein